MNNSTLRVAFETHGCRSNFADTVDLEAMCVERGCQVVPFSDDAEVYVLNSCTVTNKAERDALRTIRQLRKKQPSAKVVVTGCLAEIAQNTLLQTGLVDDVVGTGRHEDVVDSILGIKTDRNLNQVFSPFDELCASAKSLSDKLPSRKLASYHKSISLDKPMPQAIVGPNDRDGGGHYRARFHLRIQEGCENKCTFCIIPYARGGYSSRPVSRILDDLDRLHSLGYKEVVLSGTHLGGYGIDIRRSLTGKLTRDLDSDLESVDNDDLSHKRFTTQQLACSLLELIQILEEYSPIKRIRLSSLDPNDVSRELVDFLSRSKKFCAHLHICFQSFSDSLLKLMNRRYSLKEAVDLVCYVNKVWSQCIIGADLITGFPYEDIEDVEKGIALFNELPISYLHVFPYSERSSTPAAMLKGKIDVLERRVRAKTWREAEEKKRSTIKRGYINNVLEIVLESSAKEGFYYGTSREYLPVKFPLMGFTSTDYLDDREEKGLSIGTLVTVLVKDYDSMDGRLICDLLGHVKM